MRIKLYIITYNNDFALNACLDSLFETIGETSVEIFVINNYSSININKKYPITILNNSLRPDFSMGHLSRNWNQAIINGFQNLNNPDCDLLITCQNDMVFRPGWLPKLIKWHENYSFITANPGDGFCSYTVEAVKKIGLWDERFCSIEYQEADYFLRALINNRDRSSINDFHHARILNPIFRDEFDSSFISRENTDIPIHDYSRSFGNLYLFNFWRSKYYDECSWEWSEYFLAHLPRLKEKMYMMYPYFEKDVEDLSDKYHTYPGFN